MVTENEISRLGIKPYILSRDEYEKYYCNSYSVLELMPVDLFYVAQDVILEFQLRQAQVSIDQQTELARLRAALERIAAGNPSKPGEWLTDIEIARKTLKGE